MYVGYRLNRALQATMADTPKRGQKGVKNRVKTGSKRGQKGTPKMTPPETPPRGKQGQNRGIWARGGSERGPKVTPKRPQNDLFLTLFLTPSEPVWAKIGGSSMRVRPGGLKTGVQK